MSMRSKALASSSAPVLNKAMPVGLPPLFVQGRKASIVRYAHEMVRDVAEGLAHELYDTMMKSNESYAVWQAFCRDVGKEACEREFVHLSLPYLLDDARATLAGMLSQVRYQHLHESIHDALVKDNLIRGTDGLIPVKKQIEEAYLGR